MGGGAELSTTFGLNSVNQGTLSWTGREQSRAALTGTETLTGAEGALGPTSHFGPKMVSKGQNRLPVLPLCPPHLLLVAGRGAPLREETKEQN